MAFKSLLFVIFSLVDQMESSNVFHISLRKNMRSVPPPPPPKKINKSNNKDVKTDVWLESGLVKKLLL